MVVSTGVKWQTKAAPSADVPRWAVMGCKSCETIKPSPLMCSYSSGHSLESTVGQWAYPPTGAIVGEGPTHPAEWLQGKSDGDALVLRRTSWELENGGFVGENQNTCKEESKGTTTAKEMGSSGVKYWSLSTGRMGTNTGERLGKQQAAHVLGRRPPGPQRLQQTTTAGPSFVSAPMLPDGSPAPRLMSKFKPLTSRPQLSQNGHKTCDVVFGFSSVRQVDAVGRGSCRGALFTDGPVC